MYSQTGINPHEVLLRKYVKDQGVINHSHAVSFVALDAALRSICVGESCNLENVYTGAYLHDIAKETSPGRHPIVGRDILYKEGVPKEIAEIVGRHGLAPEIAKTHDIPEDLLPKTIEEKIVAYADFCVINTTWTTVDQRIKCLRRRYGLTESWKKLNHLLNAIPRIKALERELMESWSKSTYLRTYVDDVRRFVEQQEQKLIF